MRHLAAAALAAVAVAAAGHWLAGRGELAAAVQHWPGYYTVIIESGGSTAGDIQIRGSRTAGSRDRILAANLGPVVAAHTSRVRVTTFGGLEWVAVPDLASRLDQLDPRFDPYLRELPAWFAARSAGGAAQELVYVRSALPPALFGARLAAALHPVRWRPPFATAGNSGAAAEPAAAEPAAAEPAPREHGERVYLAELDGARVLAALLLFGVGAVTATQPRRSRLPRWWRLPLAVPWAFLILNGGLPAALVGLPVYAGGVWLAERHRGAGLLADLTTAVAVLAGAVLTVLVSGYGAGAATVTRVGLAVGFGAAVQAVVAAIALLLSWPPRRWQRTRRRTGGDGRRAASARLALVAAGGLLGAAVLFVDHPGHRVPRPRPTAATAAAAGITFDSLRAVGLAAAGELPVLSDYVAHVAYQETLQFGRGYALPAPAERVTVTVYARAADGSGRVLQREEEVHRFTEQWLEAVAAAAPGNSVPALLLAYGQAVAAHAEAPPARRPGAGWVLLGTVAVGGALVLAVSAGAARPARGRRRARRGA